MRNMKKLVAALLVLTMVAALAGTAFAYKEIAVSKPIVFKGTAWGYAKVTNNRGVDKSGVALKKGSYGNVVAEKGDWYKIVISGRGSSADEYLWFNKKYTRDFDSSKDSFSYLFSSGGSDRSGVLGIYSATKVAGKYTRVVVKDGRRTNVRKGCSLEGKSLGVIGKGHATKSLKLHKDHAIGVDARGVEFYHVMYKGKAAWVSSVYTYLK